LKGVKKFGTLFLWTAALFLGFQGCAGKYAIVDFEVLEPATVNFPSYVNQLLILNRAPVSMDVWAEENQEGMEPQQLVLLDTLIINNLFRGLQDVLRSSPIESYHMPIWLSDRRLDTALLEDEVLTKKEVQDICNSMLGDAIISLELYTVGMDQHFDFYTDSPDEILNHYFEVYNRVKWNIHLPDRPRPFDTYTTVDTLFYPTILNGKLLKHVPGLDMIRDLFYESGLKYGRYLVPVWNRNSRILYTRGDDSLRLAIKQTDSGDWEHAFSLWKGLTLSEDSSLVAKAYHNMAVYYELEDQLDSAQYMLDLALEHDSLDEIRSYLDEIEVRLLNRKDIEKQVRKP
jgi:hypothetical protein